MRNTGLDEAQARIKIAGKNINKLRYADDITFMAETEEELRKLLMKEKEESEKVGLKINIQKTKIMAPRLISSVLFSSVTQLCPTLCDPMNCSMPGLLVHQQLLEFTQTHSIESVMPSSHFILCRPLLLLPPIPPSIRFFSNESTLLMRWPRVSALASFLPKKSQGWSPLEWTGWIFLQSKGLSRVFSNTTVQKYQFFGPQLSSQSNSHIHTWPLEKQ